MVHEHKAAALPCVVGYEQWTNGHGRRQGTAVACGQQASCATTRTASRKRAQPRAQRAQARVPRALRPALLARTASDGSRAQRAMSRAQRAMSRAQRAMSRAQRAMARAPSERCRARTASDSSRAMSAGARSEHQCVRRLAMGMQQLCDERMGCAHMASNGCVRAAHGRATRRVFALRLDRFECLI